MSTRRLAAAREALEGARVAFSRERALAMHAAHISGVVVVDEGSELYAATRWVIEALEELGMAAVDAGSEEEVMWSCAALGQMREMGCVVAWLGQDGEGVSGGC